MKEFTEEKIQYELNGKYLDRSKGYGEIIEKKTKNSDVLMIASHLK